MKLNWLITTASAAAIFAGGAAAHGSLSPAELDPLVRSGRVLPLDALEEAALQKHRGGHVKKSEIDRRKEGYVFEAEVTDRDGEDWDMALDASTGLLLKDEKD